MRAWAKKHGLTEPIAMATGNVLTALGVGEVPAVVVIAGGQVVAVAENGATAEEITAALNRW